GRNRRLREAVVAAEGVDELARRLLHRGEAEGTGEVAAEEVGEGAVVRLDRPGRLGEGEAVEAGQRLGVWGERGRGGSAATPVATEGPYGQCEEGERAQGEEGVERPRARERLRLPGRQHLRLHREHLAPHRHRPRTARHGEG